MSSHSIHGADTGAAWAGAGKGERGMSSGHFDVQEYRAGLLLFVATGPMRGGAWPLRGP